MTRILSLSFFVLLCLCISCVVAQCPHTDTTLTKYSSVSAWNQANAAVVINANQRVLLDVSPPRLASLTINGEFVINNTVLNLNTSWIKVNAGGKFIAGSTSCLITQKVTITFFGSRTTANLMGTDPADGAPFGAKGMAVATGATLELHGYYSGASWTRLAATAPANATTIEVEDAVKWVRGDVVVLATTDFSEVVDTTTYPSNWSSVSWARGSKFPEQTEELIVKSVSGKLVTFTTPLNFTHWGQGFEKAEVGLLSRRIVFQGDEASESDEFGGHLIMRHGVQLRIQGVEFRRFGQKGILARYPVHFHLLRDAIGKGFYVKHSSIHHNFQRCLVIHESHGVLVQNTVGYKTNGHMFFLEDGGEHMNTIDRVLGINAYPVADEEFRYGAKMQVIPTDDSPSIFWITNPNNTITNNVAVGGRFGYWFLMAKQVNGLARLLFYQNSTYNPRAEEIGQFYNNVAHSSVDTGFELDGFMDEYGNSTDNGSYSPKYVFYNLTAYKCRQFGIWGKSSMSFTQVNLLDNRRAFMVNGVTHLYDSYIVGESDNIGFPRKNHARSYADLNGSNTTKICGHESYDNGGPQYSYNNVFVNFVSTPTRKAGALCPLQTGPFMLDTENRLFNLTFINANRFHIGSPLRGDNEYGWTVLDIDGSATGLKGGGWIVSQNATHLLTPNCTYQASWEAWMCPIFAEGYVQLLVVNQVTNLMDTVSVDGIDVAPSLNASLRNPRGIFVDQRSSQKFGRVLGSKIDCFNGTEDGCYQYMHNVMPRKFYSFKFLAGEKTYVKTPSYVTINMHSAMPGDYVYVSLPYPPSALPFNVSQNNLPMERVTSINNLNQTTYYYDNNTELLYVYLRNPSNSFTPRGYLNLSDYSSNAPTVHIRAKCSTCRPTLAKVRTTPTPPSLSRKEEIYLAKLENCQVRGTKPTGGSGSAYFWFYPATRELHYNINHDLTATATSIILGVGKFNQHNYTLTTRAIRSPVSPARGVFVLSLIQWADLVKGNLFVQVATKKYSNGQLRGQVQCSGTCSVPPVVPAVNACVPIGSSLYVFNDVPHVNMSAYVGTDNSTFNYTRASLCGNASIQVEIRKSLFYIGAPSSRNRVLMNLAVHKFLEFSVKVAPGYGELPLYVYLMNDTTSVRSSLVRVEGKYIPGNYLLDEYNGWQRVKIPTVDFELPSARFNLTRVAFGLTDTNNYKNFFLDEIRFVAGGSEPTTALATTADIAPFNPSICTSV